jgi:hypothetical protein
MKGPAELDKSDRWVEDTRNGQADRWTAPLQNACSSDYPALETDE